MVDLVGVVEELRKDGGNNSGSEGEKASSHWETTKRKRSKKRRNSGGSAGSSPISPFDGVTEGEVEEAKSAVPSILERTDRRKKGASQEDHQARFYADYRKVAEEYDKDFLDKYDEDLNTTLIFAGLFSAVASAFIIEVDPQLQPDSGDETAALLRVLIYKIDNTTFGNDVPTPPQWTGPPAALVQVQAILFASLAVSLLSAFLAMLGKQWLNRYVSTDLRGSPIERSQRRQRKLDGIIAWYFDYVMESLPVMMQCALLLLGSALTRYLWGIDITVAAVILTITAVGFLLFVFIVIAGAIFESCPYQTPGSRILRYVAPRIWTGVRSIPSVMASRIWTGVRSIPSIMASVSSAVGSTTKNTFRQSRVIETFARNVETYNPWWSRSEIIPFLRNTVIKIPLGLVIDVYRFGRAAFWAFVALPGGVYRLLLGWSRGAYLTIMRRLGDEKAASDLRCISWTLQTSLDKPVHLTTLELLGTLTEFSGFNPRLVADCFNVFVGCVSFTNDKLVVLQGLEQLATASVECFFQTLHLWSTSQRPGTLPDLRRRYDRLFPFETDFRGLPFYHTIRKIHTLVRKDWNPRNYQWDDYRPSDQEYTSFARGMVEAAQAEYQQKEDKNKVPRWMLRFALQSLSLDPPSPPSVIADSLVIVAIDLDCDVSDVTTLDESIRTERVSSLITRRLASMVEISGMEPLLRVKRKAISTLFPYALRLRLEQGRQQQMVDMILRAARVWEPSLEGFMWRRIQPHFAEVCRVFPSDTDFRGFPFYHPIRKTYASIGKDWDSRNHYWDDYSPSDQEYTSFARGMVEAAQAEYQHRGDVKKVPRWILRFALHSLSLDPPLPPSVVADSLVIIAVDLDCDVSDVTILDESIRTERVSSLITRRLASMVEISGAETLLCVKRKAISTLFPYALRLRLEQGRQRQMVDIILRVARVLEPSLEGFMWRRIQPHFAEVCRVFPPDTDFRGLPFYHPIRKTYASIGRDWDSRNNHWDDYSPSDQEYTSFARGMVVAAQAEYQQREDGKKVPRWILRFALHSLSLDPPSPPSVIADSLVIVAVDLDCDVSDVTTLDESIRTEMVSSLVTRSLASMVEISGSETLLRVKRKAISTLFPYALRLRLEQGRQRQMVDMILHAARVWEPSLEGFMWRRIQPHFIEACRVFPSDMDFRRLPFYHPIRKTYASIGKDWDSRNHYWDDYNPSDQEYASFARGMVGAAQAEYQKREEGKKVPRWILRFALHSLSLDPPPPPSVIADSLVIAAIDLDCDGSNITALDESTRVERVSSLIAQRLTSIVEISGIGTLLRGKRKAISTLFPYALRLEQGGRREIVDVILRAARVLESSLERFMWRRIEPHIAEVFDESSPPSLDRVITFASPYVPWYQGLNTPSAVTRWATAALAVPYSEEVGQSVVNTLLRISDIVSFQPHIPLEIWAQLKRRPTLPPVCWGRSNGSLPSIVRHVRGLGDFELLKSYLFLVWSEWDHLDPSGLTEMQAVIREEFGGITMFYQRDDLIERLDQVLRELDRGLEYFEQHKPQIDEAGIRRRKEQYGELLNTVLEVDREATEILTRSRWTFSCALPLPLL